MDLCDEKYYSLVKITRAMVLGIQNETDLRTAINCIMNGIFKLPPIKTGLVSLEALKLPSNKRTPEHFHGRTASSERLIKELIKNPNRSDKAIVAFLKSRSRIHYVTKAENMSLRSYNKINPNALWRQSYRECDIELVPNVKAKKYVYIIHGLVYNSIKEVAYLWDISVGTAYQRFVSTSKNYSEWIKEKSND